MSHIQLIELIELPTSLWMTFWDIEERVQLSLEIKDPVYPYKLGEVFKLDRNAKRERFALKPIDAEDLSSGLKTLIPVPSRLKDVLKGLADQPETRAVMRQRENGLLTAHDGMLAIVQ